MTGALNARSVSVTDAWGNYKGWQLHSSVYSGSTEEGAVSAEDVSSSASGAENWENVHDPDTKSQDTSKSLDTSGEDGDTSDENMDTSGHGQDTGEEGWDTSGDDDPQDPTQVGMTVSCDNPIFIPSTIDPRRDQVR